MSCFEPSSPEAELPGEADEMPPPGHGWLLDKRIPVATICSLLLQILVAGLWFGRTEARLDNIDEWVQQNRATDRRLAVIENRLDGMHEALDRIEHRLGLGE